MAPFAGYDSFSECVADNQDVSDPEAYCAAIKRQVEGEDALSDAERQALSDSECPDGQVKIAGECREIETVEAPPPTQLSELPSSIHLAASLGDPGDIERLEDGDTVRYTNIKLIGPGRWTDSGSRETVWYSPKAMQNLSVDPDNEVHIFHDEGNDVSEVGHVDPESVTNSDNGVFADLVIDTSTAAGEFADENLQQTLETKGAQGFGGPSVEIPPEGQVVEYNHTEGVEELKDGKISGVGLVKNPASKDVHFARQTAQRAVAMSDAQSVMQLSEGRDDMATATDASLEPGALLEMFDVDADDLDLADDKELQDIAVQDVLGLVADALGVEVAEVTDALAPVMDGGEEEVENESDEGDCPDGQVWDADAGECVPEEEMSDDSDLEDAEELQNTVASLEERVQNLEDMVESALAQEDLEELSEEIEEARDELADAETVSELEEAKEDLEKRLEALEGEPKDPRTLADDSDEAEDGFATPVDVPTTTF